MERLFRRRKGGPAVPLRFDATLKELVQSYLDDYAAQMRLSAPGTLTVLNVDLSTVTAATDVALGHGDPPDRIIDLNFQSGPDEDLDARGLLYNALLHYRYRVPVHTVLILLRPAADHVRLTGKLRYEGRRRKGKMVFSYEVVRLWRLPVRRFLKGGLGTLPLAPLCRLPAGKPLEEALAPVIRQVAERLDREATPEDRNKLLTATYVLTGLRVSPEVTDRIFQRIRGMRESSTYQAILEEGREEGRVEGDVRTLQNMLLRLGHRRFGQPTEAIQSAIKGITDRERLERMTEQVLEASSWQELLAVP